MSIYESGDFTVEKVVDYSIEYPLTEFGNTTTKVYKMIGRVNAANYTPGASLAGASGVYCGDLTPTSISGGMIEFTRLFCSAVPPSRTDYSSGTYTFPPVYGTKNTPTRYDSNGDPSRYRVSNYAISPARTEVVATRVEISYTTSPELVAVKTAETFEVVQSEGSITTGLLFGNSVTFDNEGELVINFSGDLGVTEGTTIRRWLGPIFEVSTSYKI